MSNEFDVDVPASVAVPEPAPVVIPAAELPQPSTGVDIPDIQTGSNTAPSKIPVDAKSLAVKFAIIGTGQGGSRLADTFYKIGYRRVCAINTTPQDFLGLTIPEKSLRVLSAADGGAGKNLAAGEEAIRKSSEDVMNLMKHSFGEDIEHIIVCAGLGGGTGTGSVASLVRLAKYYMRQIGKDEKVGVFVTLPKYSEGGHVQANAYNMMSQLLEMNAKKEISPFIVADNQSIHSMFPNAPAKNFWDMANKNMVGLFDIFNVLAAQKSAYTTFDRADYRSMLSSGLIIFGATKLDKYESDTDISDGLRLNLQRTLLAEGFDLTTSTHCAAVLAAPDQILSILPQSNIDYAFESLERLLGGINRGLVVHQGVYEASKMGLFLYTMVGGLQFPVKRLEMLKARGGVVLNG